MAAANSAMLHCKYYRDDATLDYTCLAQVRTSQSDYTIDGVSGSHIAGKGNDDVDRIAFVNTSMERMPRNLRGFYKNFLLVEFINDQMLPNFEPEDVTDLKRTTIYYDVFLRFEARNLAKVTRIPKKTFWDLNVVDLMLDEMPNMMNFDAEMLNGLGDLRTFSARGPNKIDQISRGFFDSNIKLKVVDFSNTRLARISYSAFSKNGGYLTLADFTNAGCLNKIYRGTFATPLPELNKDIRRKCRDAQDLRSNNIFKQVTDSSSSESDQSY